MAKKYDPQKYRQQQEELKEKISKQINEITTSWSIDINTINEYIKFISKFHQYSSNNNVLIYMQNPHAAYCGSFQHFKEQGYNVKKGEKGMKIFVPVQVTLFRKDENDDWKQLSLATKEEKEEIKKGNYQTQKFIKFKIGTVFDVAQTDCPVEDYPKYFHFGYNDKTQGQIFEGIKAFANTLSCPIEIKDLGSLSVRGYYAPSSHSITLSHLLKDSELNSVAAHELGHALMHNIEEQKNNPNKIKPQIEFEADIMGLLFANHLELEVSPKRKEHMKAQWTEIQNHNQNFDDEHKITIENELSYVQKIFAENVTTLSECINNELAPESLCENPIEQYIDMLSANNVSVDNDIDF